MLFFYFLFFWFLNSFSSVVAFNLKDGRLNLLNEFFFCLDSFSTTFIIFYIILFFLVYDMFVLKVVKLNKVRSNFIYLNLRFLFLLLRRLTVSFFFFLIIKIRLSFFSIKTYSTDRLNVIFNYLNKSRLV